MSSRSGWIKLHYQTLDSDFWDMGEPFDYPHAFLHVLLSANWKPGKMLCNGRVVSINRGQWMTSTVKLAKTFHWSREKVCRWLKIMKEYGMLESSATGLGTLITIVNYDKFQSDGLLLPTGVETGGKTGVETGVETQYKKEEYRPQTEDPSSSIFASPAPEARSADPPAGAAAEVPTEMYNDDDDDDDDGIVVHSLEEFHAVWDAIHSQKTTPSTSPESLENNRK